MSAAVIQSQVSPAFLRPAAKPEVAEDWTSTFMTFALSFYFILYVTEGLTRWLLNMAGLDAFIFLRDAAVLLAVLLIIVRRLLQGRLDAFPLVFVSLLVLHGVIGSANLRDTAPVLAGAKPYLSLLIGALAASHILRGTPVLSRILVVLWVVGFLSAGAEKFFFEWPWIGMTTEIAGTKVELSKDWQLGESGKRAGGLARSSIHLAGFMSVVGIWMFFFARNPFSRILIASLTTLTVFWTTQKGALIALVVVFAVSFLPKRFTVPGLKAALLVLLVLMIALPVVLPGYIMPHGETGVFSLQSFYDRAERMWPDAWDWYSQRSTPLFGVGLGGIGFAMRLYSAEAAFYAADLASYEPYLINFADNMFVYLFVQLGVMALVYIGVVLFGAMRLSNEFDSAKVAALAILVFCVGYGVAVSIIEDQIACMFLGAAAYYVWGEQGRAEAAAAPPRRASPRNDVYARPFVLDPRYRPVSDRGAS